MREPLSIPLRTWLLCYANPKHQYWNCECEYRDGYTPESLIRIGGEVLNTSRWAELLQLNFLKHFLGGFVKHIQLISGLSKPTSGSVQIQRYGDDGHPNQSPKLLQPGKVGIVFQFPERAEAIKKESGVRFSEEIVIV